MGNQFRTEADVMMATAGRVDDTNAQVQSELNRLRTVVDSVRGSWAGSAQVAFDSLMQRWNQSAQDLQQALVSIGENIRSNAKAFENVEADNAQAFASVGSEGLAL
ncbi:WXG100 family type VII secretion target [Corynebacterium sp. HS2168-gen11]|uniref:WXG100 family type VII secretion target n=1 Tax=Corynebacterium sp. HS2168-gen11 TaxID=2974027 RepID=UPI00216B184F|nr:WXG100 family type VII secretion target [Corynebacterium sp. HS2168-gen11]MCS4535650.1 WXG100 family type VII secretion target [Corynebacterium sp. HS2168-gen11]